MTLDQLTADYAAWQFTGQSDGEERVLAEWLRGWLANAGPGLRIQLRAFCAMRGQAAVYDRVVGELNG